MLKFVSVAHFVICRFGQPIKVNWAYASGQREDTSGWFLSFDFILKSHFPAVFITVDVVFFYNDV